MFKKFQFQIAGWLVLFTTLLAFIGVLAQTKPSGVFIDLDFSKIRQAKPRPKPVRRAATKPGLPFAPYEYEVASLNLEGQIAEHHRQTARVYTEKLSDKVKIEMVEIPGGTFLMGSPEEDLYRFVVEQSRYMRPEERPKAPGWIRAETPQHRVRLTSFFLGKYEVTQAQWRAVAALPKIKLDLPSAPSKFAGDDLPVERVTWEEAAEFCARLAQATQQPYRLPTEAEWEYAARAGTTTYFHFGNTITTDVVNFASWGRWGLTPLGVSPKQTVAVGSLGYANAWGLYDMHGNAWEWCADWYDERYYAQSPMLNPQGPRTGTRRVLRGGSWYGLAAFCRSAYRSYDTPERNTSNVHTGFRLALTVTQNNLPTPTKR